MSQNTNIFTLSKERATCSTLEQILWHTWISAVLFECVFPWTNQKISTKSDREKFFRDEKNLKVLVEYFKSPENVKKFSLRLFEFYKEHKKAFDRKWIWENEKNTLVALINTLRNYEESKRQTWTIIVSLSEEILANIRNILSQNAWIIWDIEWNLWHFREVPFFNWKIWTLWKKYIYWETRDEVLVEWKTIEYLWKEIEVNWEKLIEATLLEWGLKTHKVYLRKDLSIYKIWWENVNSITTEIKVFFWKQVTWVVSWEKSFYVDKNWDLLKYEWYFVYQILETYSEKWEDFFDILVYVWENLYKIKINVLTKVSEKPRFYHSFNPKSLAA